MSTRIVQIIVPDNKVEAACSALDQIDQADWWQTRADDDRVQLSILLKPGQSAEVVDAVQEKLGDSDDWRLIILPVEGTAPEVIDDRDEDDLTAQKQTLAREEIIASVAENGALTWNFLLMVALSAVVAAIGLVEDQVAVVIGAMVIAPLLGPLMAFSLAVALGARKMLIRAIITNLAGMAVLLLSIGALALLLPINTDSRLLDYSSQISLTAVVLPLASGAAAALAVTSDKSSAFVGVMVAAALLPPATASGLLLAAGELQQGIRAAFLVLTNILCIALAAQVVFLGSGIRPSRWRNVTTADVSSGFHITILVAFVVAIALFLFFSDLL